MNRFIACSNQRAFHADEGLKHLVFLCIFLTQGVRQNVKTIAVMAFWSVVLFNHVADLNHRFCLNLATSSLWLVVHVLLLLDNFLLTGLIFHNVFEVNAEHAASETEVTDLDCAVVVEKDVAGLEVSVNNLGGMQICEAAEDIVDD